MLEFPDSLKLFNFIKESSLKVLHYLNYGKKPFAIIVCAIVQMEGEGAEKRQAWCRDEGGGRGGFTTSFLG